MADPKTIAKMLFLESGIDERRAEETLKNKNLTEDLTTIINEAKAIGDVKSVVNYLYTIASTLPASASPYRNNLVRYVMEGKVGKHNITQTVAYLKKLGNDAFDKATFEKECGVGIVITRADVKNAVNKYFDEKKSEIIEKRYQYPLASILATIRDSLKWADAKEIKDEVDAKILEVLGPKTAEDNVKPKKAEPVKKEVKKEETKVEGEKENNLVITFPDPKENKQLDPTLLEAHLKSTGGVVVCRFPPEPNGYLHIGHAKSMNLNFSYPKKSGGYTILRYDDTNPEAEKQEYIDSIQYDVAWMGHKPAQINFSSDHFDKLYDLAIQLIKAGKAYVDHQTGDEIKEYREQMKNSPWRDRPIEENLKLFEDMKNGKFEEGKATLRMKMDMQSLNTVMRDIIAYRIKYTPHPHVGDKWCIYPTYDYTHCLIDSIENITHSLCTLEFLPRRESYYWLIDALGLYKPLVWEYSRLNISNVVLSKRKLIQLVEQNYVVGWDDPRMPTISGFRRRGFTAKSINDFCDRIGITLAANIVEMNLLEACCREDLDVIANRSMVVLEPLKVTITNWEGEDVKRVDAPNHPKDASKGTRSVPITKVIYIEKTDFRMEDVKGYKRLALNKEVGLNHAGYAIKCTEAIKDTEGNVVELKATVTWKPEKKQVQGYIHWVAEPEAGKEPLAIEVRLYDRLFMSRDPQALGDEWIKDLNPNSKVVISKAFAEPSLRDAKHGDHRQFERTGYFCCDPDTTPEKMIWNRAVTLNEAKWEGK